MACRDRAEVINAYLDGELDLSASLDLEQHLQDCPMCARAVRSRRMLAEKLREPALRYSAGSTLRERVADSLRQESAAKNPPAERGEARLGGGVAFWRTLAIAAMVALAASVTFTIYRGFGDSAAGISSPLAAEVLSGHIRSLMAAHVMDVVSTDQHTVKPWFAGKLDFSPAVEDLKDDGFPLVGGRLDYLDRHPVAALVFQRRKHVINLFTWPQQKGDAAVTVDQDGYHVRSWMAGGMSYWAVSDVGSSDLEEFVALYRARVQ